MLHLTLQVVSSLKHYHFGLCVPCFPFPPYTSLTSPPMAHLQPPFLHLLLEYSCSLGFQPQPSASYCILLPWLISFMLAISDINHMLMRMKYLSLVQTSPDFKSKTNSAGCLYHSPLKFKRSWDKPVLLLPNVVPFLCFS